MVRQVKMPGMCNKWSQFLPSHRGRLLLPELITSPALFLYFAHLMSLDYSNYLSIPIVIYSYCLGLWKCVLFIFIFPVWLIHSFIQAFVQISRVQATHPQNLC